MINQFLDWAQMQPNVWIITNLQLLEWVRNPVPISQLNDFEPFKCPVPQVNAKICNGVPADELGLVQNCAFADFPFMTCVSTPLGWSVCDGVLTMGLVCSMVVRARHRRPQNLTPSKLSRPMAPLSVNEVRWSSRHLCNRS